jgi:hypothetical protein
MLVFLLASVIRNEVDVRVWSGEQFKCVSESVLYATPASRLNSLHSGGGDVDETKGAPLGHDKSLVKGVTTASRKSGTRHTRKICVPQEQTGNQWTM